MTNFVWLAFAGDLGDHRFQAVKRLLQNAVRGGKADTDMSAGAGTEPARSAGDESHARLLKKLPAQAFRVIT